MTINYTTLLGLAEPVTGTESGTWGDDVNKGITDYLDIAIAGTQTISGSQTAVTLSVTNGSSSGSNISQAGSGSTGSAQYAIINCTGNPASLLTVTVPASSRIYHVINATSTSQSVKIVGTGPTTGVTIVSGEKATVVWNGSDYVKIGNTSGSGSFTDLTVSGNLTLSGGTANGVAYLNGSKVVTTGSALTFDGSNMAVGGASISSYANFKTLAVGGGTSGGVIDLKDATNTVRGELVGDSTGLTFDPQAGVLVFKSQSAGEVGRWTSTGLGIGTSSPGYKLDVRGNSVAGNGTIATALSYDTNGLVGTLSNHSLGIITNSTVVARFDTSGNLGLGVTPSAWYSTWKAFELNAGAISSNGSTLFQLFQNAYVNAAGNYTYKATAAATRYDQNSGAHQWYIAPSGTAGAAITFTQAMTLDASGNLGLGVTPSAWGSVKCFDLNTGGGAGAISASGTMTTAMNAYYNGTNWIYKNSNYATLFQQSAGNGSQVWYTAPSGTAGNAISFTQAMTLNAAGQLGIGTTSPSYAFDVNIATTGAKLFRFGNNSIAKYLYGYVDSGGVGITNSDPYTSGAMYYLNGSAHNWYAGSSQAMTLDASGNLLVGSTSGSSRVDVTGSDRIIRVNSSTTGGNALIRYSDNGTAKFSSGWNPATGFIVYDDAAAAYRTVIDTSGNLLVGTTSTGLTNDNCVTFEPQTANQCMNWSHYTGTSSTTRYVRFGYAGTEIGSISQNGTTAISYNTSSDYRLKENIQPMTGALAKVAALNPVTYKWKADGSDGEGFIAHELAEVCPHAVTGEKDAVDAEGKPKYQGIDTSFLVATLTAAIQEQQALINDLRARVAQLESN